MKDKCNCHHCIIENKWLSFNINKQTVIIGGIYRHPKGEIEHFNNALRNVTNKIKDDTLAIVLGDFNINLLSEGSVKVQSHLNNLLEKNFIPCITLPTRVRDYSTTLIDNIFVKNPRKLIQNKCSSGNLIFDISDHLPNFMFLNVNLPSVKDRPYIRLFTDKRKQLFLDNLGNESALITDNDLQEVNHSYDVFSNNYLNLFEKYFPYIKQSKKCFKNKPYITNGIKVSIRTRNRLYQKYLNNRSEVNEATWKRFRNKTKIVIRRAEEHYYNKILKNHKNNNRQLWNTFGKILNKNKQKHSKVGSLNINGDIDSNPKSMTESFNDYFIQIGKNLAKNFANSGTPDFKKYLGSPAKQSLLLYRISHQEIQTAIHNIKKQ